jgi:hypothetical protein
MPRARPSSERQFGEIETLSSGSLRVKVYAGIDPLSGKRPYLTETVPAGPRALAEATMVLGAYSVVNANPAYKDILVAAAADDQKEALALIKEGGCTGRYISTGLNSPSLAPRTHSRSRSTWPPARRSRPTTPKSRSPRRWHRLREHRRVLRPEQRFLSGRTLLRKSDASRLNPADDASTAAPQTDGRQACPRIRGRSR